jgi:hypothetical protein
VDNIVLCGYDIIPDNIRFQLESDSEISMRTAGTTESHNRLVITLSNIRTELKNLEFYYKRKSFPEISDQGRVTLRLGGKGATLQMVFQVDQGPEDKVPSFTRGEAHFDIQNMDIEFDKGTLKHDVLVPMVTNLFKKQIQLQLEHEVEKNLLNVIQTIGDQLTQALAQVNRPFMGGVDSLRSMIKQSEVAQVFEKRREKLE